MAIESIPDRLLRESSKECCRNELWREKLCPYHEGFVDGIEVYIDAISDPHYFDGDVDET
jgi:hypothetical protein